MIGNIVPIIGGLLFLTVYGAFVYEGYKVQKANKEYRRKNCKCDNCNCI